MSLKIGKETINEFQLHFDNYTKKKGGLSTVKKKREKRGEYLHGFINSR